MVEGAWLRAMDIGERPDLEGTVVGRGSWLAAHNLAASYEQVGNPVAAERYREMARQRPAPQG